MISAPLMFRLRARVAREMREVGRNAIWSQELSRDGLSLVGTGSQLIVADHMRGRMMALRIMSYTAALPIGAVIQGALSRRIGLERHLRRLRHRPDDDSLIFTDRGRMYWLKVHRIPDDEVAKQRVIRQALEECNGLTAEHGVSVKQYTHKGETKVARYRFSWAMRRLFEYEPFHVVQTIFPYAYTFWVVGSHDKTPKRRHK